MAPKAYDDEHELVPHAADEVFSPSDQGRPALLAPLRNVSLGESLTVLTLIYLCTVTAFNAAYFAAVPGSFVEFFTITDLIQTDLPVIQYFISLFLFYTSVGVLISYMSGMTGVNVRERLRDLFEPLIIKHHIEGTRFWTVYGIAVAAFYLVYGIINSLGVTSFTALMLPTFIFQGALLYFFWVGYKFELIDATSLAKATLIGVFMCSYNAGSEWLKSQIADPSHVQAIQDKDGNCADRNILRVSSSGILIYNPSLKQFEFRNKDMIKTVFQTRGCV